MDKQKYDIGCKCFGVYLGVVIQHLTHGQLKVYIQGVYPEEWQAKPELLPICHQVVPQFAGSHNGNGVFSYPNIGATVVCMFANGDQNLPLMIGSLQGGMNAFGQYEHIKTNDELSSTKHLITAGKAHYKMYESGKISAIVVDPIRTQADVDYGTEVDSPLSIDAVTSRPIQDKVDSKELSSIDCQHVLDNFYGHGTISSSTHWYDPTSYSTTTVLSAEQKTTIEKKNGKAETDSYYIVDNDGHREFGHTRKTTSSMISNVVDLVNQTNINEVIPLTSEVKTSFKHNLDGSNLFNTVSTITDAYSYNYINNATKQTILSTHNIKVNANSGYGFGIDSSFGISGNVNSNGVETYVNSTTGDNKLKTEKFTNKSSIIADGKNSIVAAALSSSRLFEMDEKIGLTHINKHNAKCDIDQSTNNGVLIDSNWDDDDIKILNSTAVQTKHTNFANLDLNSGENPSLEVSLQKKFKKSVNGAQQDYNVVCDQSISPTDGIVKLSITDKMTKKGCTFEMDSKGNMKINATDSISIEAPIVTIKGTSMTQQFATLIQTASTMVIKGAQGDCKIKNVSLLNHKHIETQSGDVVSPQPTKIATQSN